MIGFNKTPAAVGFNKLPAPAAPAAAAAAPAAPFTDQLVAFCARATEGRPPSHGVAHMTAVRLNAERIFDALRASSAGKTDGTSAMMNDQTRRMVQAAAQFHDVADHKYVEEGQAAGGGFGVLEELQKHFSPKASASLVKVMAAVSFSKERALRAAAGAAEQPFAFEATLGAAGALLRDIVSDADKLEAIGSVGVQRCMAYKRERCLEKENRAATEEEVVAELIKHGEEKLFVLVAHRYIRTSAGRAMAAPRQRVMLDEVCAMIQDRPEECARLRKTYGMAEEEAAASSSSSSGALADHSEEVASAAAAAAAAAPLQSPMPSAAVADNKTPGTASAASKSLDASSSSSSSSSYSSSSSSSSSGMSKMSKPPAKRRKLEDGHGSWHNAANTAVVKNGVITGLTKRDRAVKSMNAEELAAQGELYAK